MTLDGWGFILLTFTVWVVMPVAYGVHTIKLFRYFRRASREVVPNDARHAALDRVLPLVTRADFRRFLLTALTPFIVGAPLVWLRAHDVWALVSFSCLGGLILSGAIGSGQWRVLVWMQQLRKQILNGAFFEETLFSEPVVLEPALRQYFPIYAVQYRVRLNNGKRAVVTYGENLSKAKAGRLFAYPVKVWGFRVKLYVFCTEEDLGRLVPQKLRQCAG